MQQHEIERLKTIESYAKDDKTYSGLIYENAELKEKVEKMETFLCEIRQLYEDVHENRPSINSCG